MSALMPWQSALQKIKVAMILTLTPAPISIHPYSDQQGWKTLPQLTYQMLVTPANQGLQQTGSPFSQISMLYHTSHTCTSKHTCASNTN